MAKISTLSHESFYEGLRRFLAFIKSVVSKSQWAGSHEDNERYHICKYKYIKVHNLLVTMSQRKKSSLKPFSLQFIVEARVGGVFLGGGV